MTFAEGIQHIVENIETSRENRRSEIGQLNREVAHIQADARRVISSFGSARKQNAVIQRRNLRNCVKTNRKVVREFLHDAHETRVEAARETQENLEDFVGAVKTDVANIRIDANNMVRRFADERVSHAIALSRMLKAYTDGITGDVEQLMDEFGEQRSEVRGDLSDGHWVWQRHMQKEPGTIRPVLKAAPVEQRRPKKEPEKEPGDELQVEVLKVIRHSPKGISLGEAGEKLDIEWRKLVGPAKHLQKEGLIRKKESRYFPVS